ncbi:helix-turn-helix domain-containing protein [Limimaricola cinnabarinus]|uniref:helix-turn-helix domain-containing protein n=1 Tax=Limimaricola cinnabarinus TaxID=1125964 RepID=UPI002FE2CA5D
MTKSYQPRPQAVRASQDLGQALRAFRRAKGLTQAQLGRLAGLQAHHVSMIETGATNPTASTIFGLLAALDLDCVLTQRGIPLDGPPRTIEDIFDDNFPSTFGKARGTVDPDIDLKS